MTKGISCIRVTIVKKKTKIIWICGLFAVVLISLVSISLFSTNQQVKRMNGKILQFVMSLKDTSWMDPKGEFIGAHIEASALHDVPRSVWFVVPSERMEEFERVYRESIKNGVQTGYNPNFWKINLLRIQTTAKKEYKVYINWTSDHLYFENGLKTNGLQNILNDIMEKNKANEKVPIGQSNK